MRRQSARFSSSDRWRRDRFRFAHPCGRCPPSSPLVALLLVTTVASSTSCCCCSSLSTAAWSASMDDALDMLPPQFTKAASRSTTCYIR
ncbi:Os03g0764125 [Oryza sativa Japonica Group]|uniref:Os03g0764125 protein n=1 Tax=Oryza sativa subsp. japonica TaxID=39947 RepID=A0A0P0W3Y0_ORYSJ|nr:hypothetical protein EE612_020627 [Oryza sativa]BAS86532.1 Os03g0764125 [Oryza sativa Japonica Group]